MGPLVYIWVKSPAKQSSWIMRLQLLGVIFSQSERRERMKGCQGFLEKDP